MSRPASIQKPVFIALTLAWSAAAWWGCAKSAETQTTETTSSSTSGQGGSTSSGSSGTGGTGGIDTDFDGGNNLDDGGSCTSTSAAAHAVPLDIIFLIDQSGSMTGSKWIGTTTALTTFFNDPKSANIGAGLVYFPTKTSDCFAEAYEKLDVPINVLPANAFLLTNSMPADATGYGTPTYGALKGALMAATAYQDSHPTHKVAVVLATDGEPYLCDAKPIADIAALAKSARNYNGVLTYVIGVSGSIIANLNKIAVAGGTTAAYDITNDINEFSAKMAEIRSAALGCDFEIPPPPGSQQLDPDKVNFSYTPKGMGASKLLLRADDLADCNGNPGWYYDNNLAPTKIILCPATCATVQADSNAKVSALFGCKSQVN